MTDPHDERDTPHTHEPEWQTVRAADRAPDIIDVWCKCGHSGSVAVPPEEVQWDTQPQDSTRP